MLVMGREEACACGVESSGFRNGAEGWLLFSDL